MNELGVSFLYVYVVKDEMRKGTVKNIEVEEFYNNFKTQLMYHKSKNISITMKS